MTQRLFFYSLALIGLLAAGCRSKPVPELYKPGDTEVWRTVDKDLGSDGQENPRVQVETNQGSFVIELFSNEAPLTVENFLEYVDSGFYDGTIFHRVIPGFMVQGGGFTRNLEQKPTRDPIKNEAGNGLRNRRGTVAMARTGDVDSATAQFFINMVNNPFLNGDGESGGYAVFGRVVSGMQVVDDLVLVETETVDGKENVPVEPVVIEQIRRVEK